MNSIYFIRLKLIFRDKLTGTLLMISFLLFLMMINSLSLNAEKKSNIPIGLINLDNSKSADELVENMKQVPSLSVYEGDEDDLRKLLYEEQINALFIIEDGYEKLIRSGQTNDLITMYYLEENGTVKILSDIFAGEMLYKICLYKGYQRYKSLPENEGNESKSISGLPESGSKRLTEKEYMEYAGNLMDSTDFNFSFDIAMVNVENDEKLDNQMMNSIIYQQIILGILGIILSFTAMLMAAVLVLEKETGINKRIGISLLRSSTVECGQLGAMLTVLSIFSLLVCFIVGGKVVNFTWSKGVELFLLTLLFCYVMGLLFIILAKIVNKVGNYQCIGVIFILTIGIIGFFNIIQGFLSNKLLNIINFIPNSWFIQGFTAIILNAGLQDIPYTAYTKLTMTAIFLSVINIMIRPRQNK